MDNRTIKELAIELTVEVTALCDNIKGRAVFTNQLIRSCSSIGANSHEGKYAQSKADFINKMEIAFFTSERSELISHPSASLDISLEQSENIAFKRKLEYIARAERVYTDLT